MTETKEVIREKLDYFYSNSIKVHLSKFNNTFINGYITEKISESVYIIMNDETKEKTTIFVSEVFDVINWVEKSKDKDE